MAMSTLKKTRGSRISKLCMLILIIGLSACAPRHIHYPPAMTTTLPSDAVNLYEEAFWRGCRFKISWPPETEINWAVDLLLAHAVVGPVLQEHSKKLYWWRFHRRAAPDKTGHQFSFLFFSDSKVAAEIMEDLRKSRILQELLEEQIVEQIIFDDPDNPSFPKIESMSDPKWSPALQRNWPSYIMGVSSLWLGLIDDLKMHATMDESNIRELLENYRQVEASITSMWYKEGQHAFLHHLNAIFGYEPMLIIDALRF